MTKQIKYKVKSKNENSLSTAVQAINVFGVSSSARGHNKTSEKHPLILHHSKGVGYLAANEISKGCDLVDKYKVMISRTISEHAGEPGKEGNFKLIAKCSILKPCEICTHSYLIIGKFDNEVHAQNLMSYLQTKFLRFLVLQAISSIDLSREKFNFVPTQDFNKSWTDEKLYKKYGLNEEEIAFIESMVRPME